ncbi:uncharacterized protein LOC142588779 [Dermacentor variabilis]|uniref:uncharacterized protein LOC142588779 n=1 Tax=Dermacentor variabilis TaxID=34621 RepID=UPI003F5AE9A8
MWQNGPLEGNDPVWSMRRADDCGLDIKRKTPTFPLLRLFQFVDASSSATSSLLTHRESGKDTKWLILSTNRVTRMNTRRRSTPLPLTSPVTLTSRLGLKVSKRLIIYA